MSEQHIEKNISTKTDWVRLRSATDDEIDQAAKSDPDAQPTNVDFWADAQQVFPKADQEIVAWFKERYGEECHEKMNAVLRDFMEDQTTS